MMSKDSKKWSKEDQDKLVQIISALIVQGHEFKNLSTDGPLTGIFSIQKPDEFGLGMLIGIVFSEFNSYWVKKYDVAISKENMHFMISQINQVSDIIRKGFDK